MHQCKLHLGPGAAEARPLTTQPVQQGQIAAHRAANRVRVQARNAVEGPIRVNLCHPARAKVRVHARNTVEDAEVDQEQPQATGFSAAVQRLLHRAASTLTRGTTTCLTCRGQGTCSCPACNGSGITNKDARQNVMRHTAQKLRSVLHVERSEYHSDWLTSNRCRRCHGTGLMVCPTCQGLGTRHASAGNNKTSE